jgi:hypothetical protein
MSKSEVKFVMGVLAHFITQTASITQARMAKEVINKLNQGEIA